MIRGIGVTSRICSPPESIALAASLVVLACAPSRQSTAQARSVERALERSTEGLESEREALRRALVDARTASAAAEAAPHWRKAAKRDAESEAWRFALHEAWSYARSCRERSTALDEHWARASAGAAEALARARTLAEELHDRRATGDLARSEIAWQQALEHAARGRLVDAAREASRAALLAERVEERWAERHARFYDPGLRRQWSQWVELARRESLGGSRPVLLVDKLRRTLQVLEHGSVSATFPVELGVNGLEQKQKAGDRATPEGRYRVQQIRVGGQTRFYKALLLDYPNREDRERIPADTNAGGMIEIHGEGGRGLDWTDGCVALRNEHMDELLGLVRLGTPVTIVGTVP